MAGLGNQTAGVIHLPQVGTLASKIQAARSVVEASASSSGGNDAALREAVKGFQADVESLTQRVARQLEYARTLRTRPDVKQLLQENESSRQRKVCLPFCDLAVRNGVVLPFPRGQSQRDERFALRNFRST